MAQTYTVIDAHVHMSDDFKDLDLLLADMRKAMGESGFSAICLVSDPSAGWMHLHKNLLCLLYKLTYKDDAVYLFAGLDYHIPGTSLIDNGFGLQAGHGESMGVDGFKLYEGKPSARKRCGNRPLDSAAYGEFFKILETKGLPVAYHLADPPYFWQADRISAYQFSSGWFFGDSTYPTWETLYQEFVHVLKAYPHLNVIVPQLGYLLPDFERLSGLLEDYPHLYFDIGPTEEFYQTLADRPAAMVAFINQYRQRIIFACTGVCSDWSKAGEKPQRLYAALQKLGLEDETLNRLYRENFLKLVGQPKALNKALVLEYADFIKDHLHKCPGHTADVRNIRRRVDEIHQRLSDLCRFVGTAE